MESQIQAVMARVQDIEARLGMVGQTAVVAAPTAPTPTPAGWAEGASPNNRPFDVMLNKANGGVRLAPLSASEVGGAGPFAPATEALISKYASQNGLEPALVRAVIQQESSGNTRSVSASGAKGLMQLMPETARQFGVSDAFDPEQNIAAGTRMLSGLLREFKGDTSLALAAYNAGSGSVKKYGGVPPYSETQQYVRKIMAMLPAR